jgi:hypothetical protein
MQHVPLQDRLTSCCLVNKRCHAAAVAATQHVQFGCSDTPVSRQMTDCLLQWLPLYGQHLTSLDIRSLPQPLQHLPCPNLLQLRIEQCTVQLGPLADGHPCVIQSCTKLTSLILNCELLDAPDSDSADDSPSTSALSSLVHLQHLEVGCTGDEWSLSGATMSSLSHLTYFSVEYPSVGCLSQLSALTNLEELHSSIDDPSLDATSAPGLNLPASLTKLMLSQHPDYPPVVVSSLLPTGLQDLWIEHALGGPAEGPASFLCGLARLQHLTSLHLNFMYGSMVWPPAGAAYSALTASSNLVSFVLVEPKLPAGVWPFVFSSTHRLPHLTYLRIQDHDSDWSSADPPSALGAADVSSLVGCCPNLCTIKDIPMGCMCLSCRSSQL